MQMERDFGTLVGLWGQSYIIHFAFGHRENKLGGVHKIINLGEYRDRP